MKILKILFLLIVLVLYSCSLKSKSISSSTRAVSFSGGNGTSLEEAVLILNAKNLADVKKAKTTFLNKTISNDWQILNESYSIESKIEILKIKTSKPDSIFEVFFSMKQYKGK